MRTVIRRHKGVPVVLAALLVVGFSPVALAAAYYTFWDTGALLFGTNYLETYGTTQAKYVANQHSRDPAYHLTTATLYRGGQLVHSEPNPGNFLPGPKAVVWGADTGIRTTTLTGQWVGIGWHWAQNAQDASECSQSVYTYAGGRNLFHPPGALTAHHVAVLDRLGLNIRGNHHEGLNGVWTYVVDLGPSARTEVLRRADRVALDRLYHTVLQPAEMRKGDYFPFLLIAESGLAVKAVFPKADGRIQVIDLTLSSFGWSVAGGALKGESTTR